MIAMRDSVIADRDIVYVYVWCIVYNQSTINQIDELDKIGKIRNLN